MCTTLAHAKPLTKSEEKTLLFRPASSIPRASNRWQPASKNQKELAASLAVVSPSSTTSFLFCFCLFVSFFCFFGRTQGQSSRSAKQWFSQHLRASYYRLILSHELGIRRAAAQLSISAGRRRLLSLCYSNSENSTSNFPGNCAEECEII